MDLAWWSEVEYPPHDQFPSRSFRFGRRIASVFTDNSAFGERFLEFFRDCLEPARGEAPTAAIGLQVSDFGRQDAVLAELCEHDYEPDPSVIEGLLPDTKLAIVDVALHPEWRAFAYAHEPSQPVLAFRGRRILISKRMPWQMLAAHYFLYHVMRLQQEMVFLHGASLAIGKRGVFLGGAKGAGKSTVSLALAARGHGFLGDEVAAIQASTGVLLPFRRAVSIRAGAQAPAVSEYIQRTRPARETLPDGTVRIRMSVSEIFPGAAPREVLLSDVILLHGFGELPAVEPFVLSRQDIGLLGTLPATIAARGAAAKLVGLVNLFSRVRCYKVAVGGTPDEMADVVERITEGRWATPYKKEPSASEHFAG
jgi:hypothetical protein